MEIKFLGTGGASDITKGNAAATVTTSEGFFLIDCGPSIYAALIKNDLIGKIDYILPTHLHGDHTGSLFSLAVHYRYQLKDKLKIVYPTERIRDDIKALFDLMFQFEEDGAYEFVSLAEFSTIGFIDTFGQHAPEMPSVAYYFCENDELIYYSGDLGNVQSTEDFLTNRNESTITVFHDINKTGGISHVNYKAAAETLAAHQVYGYHCAQETMPEDNTIALVENVPELLYPYR